MLVYELSDDIDHMKMHLNSGCQNSQTDEEKLHKKFFDIKLTVGPQSKF